MTPWGLVLVALAGMVAPFFIAPLIDRNHPSFTAFGLGIGFMLSLAFGTWRLIVTLPRLDSVAASPHGFTYQAFLVVVGTLTAAAIAGALLLAGVAIGGLLDRWLNRPAS